MKHFLLFITISLFGFAELSAQSGYRNAPLQTQVEAKSVVISPNPATSLVEINAETSGKLSHVIIYSIIGNEVLNAKADNNNLRLNIGNLKKGKYIVRSFFSNGTSEVTTLIKQ
ncbi:T9SS type A sorting domain-containing protein [Vaginella massiliensis]|uniref:T9SS type A sorting domain-containing protein n=1 Tax=Vaginella massiliensis TaxID=1816680 RepID=UPI0008395BE9|nr:T9SS type A sorting domain-containing protein [Vaginella massiliensis]